MCTFCWQLSLCGANFLLPARTALLQSSEETFCTTWISILAQLLAPKLADLETEGYQSSSLPFRAGDGLSISCAPALLECSLKASSLSGAWECTLSQKTCPCRERNIYQVWQKRDRLLAVNLMIHPTPFQANEARPLFLLCKVPAEGRFKHSRWSGLASVLPVKNGSYSPSHSCRHQALDRNLNLQHCQLTQVMDHDV